MIARVAAVAALAAAIVVVVLVVLGGSAVVHAACGLPGRRRAGDGRRRADGAGQGRVGPVDLAYAPTARRSVTMAIDSGAAPLHEGTVARIYENSLSGIATKYVVLEPAPTESPEIPDGGTIGLDADLLVRQPGSGVRLDRPADPGRTAGRDPGRGDEHPGPGGSGVQDAQVPGAGAGQHEQPDRRARPQRTGVRRAARPGGTDDAGAGLAGAAAERPDRPGEHHDRRGGAGERRAPAGAPAAPEHAHPVDRARSRG